ncbi:MAG: dephospho-CoA kinase [Pseudomonadota bacterium]
MIVLGITGSIGMGKSTIGGMLQTLGVPVHESDHAVHELLQPGRAGYIAVAAEFPLFEFPQIFEKKNKEGRRPFNRKTLGDLVFNNEEYRVRLENILHPLVRKSQVKFVRDQKRLGKNIVALDIPLLFETEAQERVDFVINASAPHHVQRERVLDRPGMTEEKFEAILEKQMPDTEKCTLSDYIVHTGLGRAQSMKELKEILKDIKSKT